MDKELVGYLLNALDDDSHREVERRLLESPELRSRLDVLRSALGPLGEDGNAPPPPASLVPKTIGLIAEYVCRPLPKAPAPAYEAVDGGKPWWRRVDVLLAACLLIAVIGMGGPFLVHSQRLRHQTVLCQENLRQLFPALESYHDAKKSYPNIAQHKPLDVAGMVVPILHDAGTLKTGKPLICPTGTTEAVRCPTLDELRAMPSDAFAQHAADLNPTYAYHLGFKDAAGYHPPARAATGLRSLTPIMADTPRCDGSGGNSANHHGHGQNVLFQDGHVKFVNSRAVGIDGDDIFLNKDRRVAAGLDRTDTVLGCSSAKP